MHTVILHTAGGDVVCQADILFHPAPVVVWGQRLFLWQEEPGEYREAAGCTAALNARPYGELGALPVDGQACPLRSASPQFQQGPWDTWQLRVGPDGPRFCSFCGSIHRDDFLALLENERLESLELNDRRNKIYIRRRGKGLVKLKTAHLQPEDRPVVGDALMRFLPPRERSE
jgi:hypothetical protein